MARMLSGRITTDPAVCHGEPCIAGTRVMVSVVLDHVAGGLSVQQVIDEFPGLTREDIQAVFAYAARAVRQGQEIRFETEA